MLSRTQTHMLTIFQAYRKSVLSSYERLPDDRISDANLATAVTQSLVAHLPMLGSPVRGLQLDSVHRREVAEHEHLPEVGPQSCSSHQLTP